MLSCPTHCSIRKHRSYFNHTFTDCVLSEAQREMFSQKQAFHLVLLKKLINF